MNVHTDSNKIVSKDNEDKKKTFSALYHIAE